MIFSGTYQERTCPACGYTTGRATPTSLLYFLLLVGVGSAIMIPALHDHYGPRWWYWVAVPAGELILVLLLLPLLVIVRDAVRPSPSTCPRCSGHMKVTASGWYDFGCLPTLVEIVLAVIFIALHVGVAVWLAGSAVGSR